MSIQILQYEFLGPIPLSDWGPPMAKLIYVIMSRNGEKFNIVYAGNCSDTNDKTFFTQHEHFKCWVQHTGSEESLHLAIFPMPDSNDAHRNHILNKILSSYRPPCNPIQQTTDPEPSYTVRQTEEDADPSAKVICPCCGSEMKEEPVLEKSTLYRCTGCGMSDTRLK